MISLRYFTTTSSLKRVLPATIPSPTTQIPDVESFLTKIGRNSAEFTSNFPNWNSLFTATSNDLKSAGIDVPTRRYILKQVEYYRRFNNVNPIKKSVKKNGGERKLNQYLAQKRILDRIKTAQQLKIFRKESKNIDKLYEKFDKIHHNLGHTL